MKITIEADSVEELRTVLRGLLETQRFTCDKDTAVSELGLMTRTSNCLFGAKIETVGQLIKFSGLELRKIPNFGLLCLDDVNKRLAMFGLSLSQTSASGEEYAKRQAIHGI